MYCITADAKETGNEGGGNGDGGTITAAHIADAVLKKNTEIQNLIFSGKSRTLCGSCRRNSQLGRSETKSCRSLQLKISVFEIIRNTLL